MEIYKTLIKTSSNVWVRNLDPYKIRCENLLRIFERKKLRKVYGPIQERDTWRIRNNKELDRSLNEKDITKFMKAQRIRWLDM